MSGADWARVKGLVSGALSEPEEARAAYLAAHSGSDVELLQEAESLLAATHEAAVLFEEPSVRVGGSRVALDPIGNVVTGILADEATGQVQAFIGRRIGPYRIVREIGRGGMGSVFLAERADDEFRQRVALKIASAPTSP